MDELSYLSREPRRSRATLLNDLHDLNREFLALVTRTDAPGAGLDEHTRETLRSLSEQQHERLTTCPYALFDVRFADASAWREALAGDPAAIGENMDASASVRGAFVVAVLLYTRQLCQHHDDMARLLLGMTEEVVQLLANASLPALTACAFTDAPRVTARLVDHPNFWSDLLDFVRDGTRERNLAAHTLGVQHSAAKF